MSTTIIAETDIITENPETRETLTTNKLILTIINRRLISLRTEEEQTEEIEEEELEEETEAIEEEETITIAIISLKLTSLLNL